MRWRSGADRRSLPSGVLAIIVPILAVVLYGQDSKPADALPILSQKCFQCHGAALKMSNLDLRTRESILKGGDKGPAIVPGNAEASLLFKKISGLEKPAMPMAPLPALTPLEISVIKGWIDQGAPENVAQGETARAATAVTSSRNVPLVFGSYKERVIVDADRQWWAFQKPVRPAIPQIADARWRTNPIDALVRKKMDEQGLTPAPMADRNTLIRRVYLDVTGLLPSPSEVDAFVNDPDPKAYEKLVDKLLESPHYGERWARMWLDTVRYADTSGFEGDGDIAQAWRYRDYVIKAFNEDKPYKQFVIEQLAGDELEKPTNDSLIATTYYRIGPRVRGREQENPNYRFDLLDDIVRTTYQGFLGLSVNCARCHDHKFDPITRMDYYRSIAMFQGLVDANYPTVPAEEFKKYQTAKAEADAKAYPFARQISKIESPYKKAEFEKHLATFPADVQEAVKTPEDKRTPGQQLLATQVGATDGDDGVEVPQGQSAATAAVAPYVGGGRGGGGGGGGGAGRGGIKLSPEDEAERTKLIAQIREIEKDVLRAPQTMPGVRDGDFRYAYPGDPLSGGGGIIYRNFGISGGKFLPEPGDRYEPPPLYFLANGLTPFEEEIKNPVVQPGFLTVLDDGKSLVANPPKNGPYPTSGRRKALAEWIVSEDNPLAARVMVNRLWYQHFGTGIVGTPNNFGKMGVAPSNPELLDWLATEFVQQGWSIKQMQRLIMNSETYKMASSYYQSTNLEKDPADAYLWRFPLKRLEAEIIRDTTLVASGQLNMEAGGPGFFPSVPKAVVDSAGHGRWTLTKEEPATWRRSVYAQSRRNMKYPMFDVFDQPDTNFTCERRSVTMVPTQALTMLNNDFFLIQAQLLAERVKKEAGDDRGTQIATLYRIAYSRKPTQAELDHDLAFIQKEEKLHQAATAPSAGPKATPDSNPDALTGLADVILNSSEFVYTK